MKLFELYATLGLDSSGFDKGVNDAQKEMTSLGDKLSARSVAIASAAGNLISAGIKKAASGVVNLAKQAVTVSADVAAENAQFSATFGDLADSALAAYGKIGKETNILTSRLKATGTKGYAQLTGAGYSANEALEKSSTLLQLSADAAAYYDISLEDADTRIRSFMRGNTEAGDAIGLFTSETQRNSRAMELYKKKWNELTEAQRQNLMLNVAQEIYKQSGVVGQAAREGHEWLNVTQNLSESWRQTLANLGEPIREALIPGIEKVTEFLNNSEVQEGLAEIATELGNITVTGMQGLIESLKWFIDHGDEFKSAADNVTNGVKYVVDEINKNRNPVTPEELQQDTQYDTAKTILTNDVRPRLFATGWEWVKSLVTGKNEGFEKSKEGLSQYWQTFLEKYKQGDGGDFLLPINPTVDMRKRLSQYQVVEMSKGEVDRLLEISEKHKGSGGTWDISEAASNAQSAMTETANVAVEVNKKVKTSLDEYTKAELEALQASAERRASQAEDKGSAAFWTQMGKIYADAADAANDQGSALKGAAEAASELQTASEGAAEAKDKALAGGKNGVVGECAAVVAAMNEVTSAANEAASAIQQALALQSQLQVDDSGQFYRSTGGGGSRENYSLLDTAYGASNTFGKRHAVGLSSVPFDGYLAKLHRGEAVLTRQEADAYRGQQRGQRQEGVTIVQNIRAVAMRPSEVAAQTRHAFDRMRFAI